MQKEVIKIDEISGFDYNIYRYTIDQGNPGRTIYIQANVHGAEVQGNAVIWRLVEHLKNKEVFGRIILVPQANPYASGNKLGTYTFGRFNPVTGDNWNRMYFDFFKAPDAPGFLDVEKFVREHGSKDVFTLVQEYKREILKKIIEFRKSEIPYGISENKNLFTKLQELASEADFVLDLHTAGTGCRYIYTPEYAAQEASHLLFPHYIVIPNEFGGAMDEASFNPWVKLYEEMKKQGHNLDYKFEAYTIELGSEEHISMDAARDDANRILNYLNIKGFIKTSPDVEVPQQYYCQLKDYKMYRAPSSGLCEYHLSPGEHFKKGDKLMTIYRYDNLEDLSSSQTVIHALTDGIVINHTPSGIVKSGMDLLEAFTF